VSDAPAALHALAADPTAPVKLLIVGGIGTGKTTLLASARELLGAAGVTVQSTVAQTSGGATAVVVDDAHTQDPEQLAALTTLAADPASTLIVAAEPLAHDPALRALTAALERQHPRIVLQPWSRAEVSRTQAGADSAVVDAIMTATAGLPLLVDAVRRSASADITQTVHTTLTERLRRLEEPQLATLVLMTLDPALGPADIAAAVGVDTGLASTLVDQAYAGGLLDAGFGPSFIASVHTAAARLIGTTRHKEIESSLLATQSENGTLSTTLAVSLAEHGFTDVVLAQTLQQRAATAEDGPQRVRLLRAALAADGETADQSLQIRLADAYVRVADCVDAVTLTDALLGSVDPGVRADAVRIAASVAAHDGNNAQAAELLRWLSADAGAALPEAVRAAGTIVMIAAGDADGARRYAAAPVSGPPTSAARVARALADGVLLTLDASYDVAAARLAQAVGTAVAGPALPDSAPALLALTALHAGDPLRAGSVLTRALTEPDAVFDPRHQLLLAWTRMLDGQLAAAGATTSTLPATLHGRDALWAAALQTAIARRAGDSGALARAWTSAMDVLAEYTIDLFTLLPLGELWVAGARLHQSQRLAHPLAQGFAVLQALDNPVSWSLPLHWAGVHAAILRNAPEDMAPHGQALTAAAASGGYAAALAGAGRAWLRVLARQVDADEVTAAARGLAQFGLTWDGTRLAGQAALAASDPRVSGVMLQVARDLKLAVGGTEEPAVTTGGAEQARPPAAAAPTASGRAVLSEREREVAELLLLGMPYRDIGAQLFISAKTVEHHVARIRRRLGAESRSEMLSMLRAMLAA